MTFSATNLRSSAVRISYGSVSVPLPRIPSDLTFLPSLMSETSLLSSVVISSSPSAAVLPIVAAFTGTLKDMIITKAIAAAQHLFRMFFFISYSSPRLKITTVFSYETYERAAKSIFYTT